MFTLSSKNIDSVLSILKRKVKKANPAPNPMFIVPMPQNILSKRYSGKGRPKKIDYDFVNFGEEIVNIMRARQPKQ